VLDPLLAEGLGKLIEGAESEKAALHLSNRSKAASVGGLTPNANALQACSNIAPPTCSYMFGRLPDRRFPEKSWSVRLPVKLLSH